MELSIEEFMEALKDELDKQEIFLSECDFQLNLAKKLKECLEDKNRYDSKEIQEFILNKYSWNDVVERTMKIYKEIKK